MKYDREVLRTIANDLERAADGFERPQELPDTIHVMRRGVDALRSLADAQIKADINSEKSVLGGM